MTDFNKHYMETQREKIRKTLLPPSDKIETTQVPETSEIPQPAAKNWYYVLSGQKLGPESSKTLIDWVSSGTLSLDDLVWRTGMTDWSAIRNTDLKKNLSDTPPPVIGEHVNNIVVWSWAFAPLIPISAILVAIGSTIKLSSESQWIAAFAVNTILWWIDGQQIKNAGHDRSGWGFWGFLVVPVYLFVRAAKLKQRNGYAIVWLVCFLLSVFAPRLFSLPTNFGVPSGATYQEPTSAHSPEISNGRPILSNQAANEYFQKLDEFLIERKTAISANDVAKIQSLNHTIQDLETDGAEIAKTLSPSERKQCSDYLTNKMNEMSQVTQQEVITHETPVFPTTTPVQSAEKSDDQLRKERLAAIERDFSN